MSDPNDLTAFLDEAWRHLQRGVADSRSPARYPTFATVAADGTPEARTVALRGASRSLYTLEVHTDSIRPVKARFQAFSGCQCHGMSSSMRLIL